jgi:hypothetical protein
LARDAHFIEPENVVKQKKGCTASVRSPRQCHFHGAANEADRAKSEKKCHLFAIGKILSICFILIFFFWCTLGLSHLRTDIYFKVR